MSSFNSQSVFHNIGHRVISKSLSKCSFSISGFQYVSLELFFERNSNNLGVGFSCGSAGKESACNVGNLGLIPGLGRPPGEGEGYPLQYFCLENPMDRGTWYPTVHGVAESQT